MENFPSFEVQKFSFLVFKQKLRSFGQHDDQYVIRELCVNNSFVKVSCFVYYPSDPVDLQTPISKNGPYFWKYIKFDTGPLRDGDKMIFTSLSLDSYLLVGCTKGSEEIWDKEK